MELNGEHQPIHEGWLPTADGPVHPLESREIEQARERAGYIEFFESRYVPHAHISEYPLTKCKIRDDWKIFRHGS